MVTVTRRPHTPIRPIWLCRACGHPWPCGEAKLALLAEYGQNRVSLFVYLAGAFGDAVDDLGKLHSGETPISGELFDRFLSWPSASSSAYRTARIEGSSPT
ncbi:hypothetical protein [Micromonospora inyonensis]|uniref:Flavin reductase n=1 Tax=Micromonospora inyonensis TaxID=47866 RepID=A0A1C6RPC8_9ACTN|nr:hypothetical protein [Micromonospora inyonensis]SCL19042.1 hypothetical protein GA0074694_2552 [Micromonospora inyonensis]